MKNQLTALAALTLGASITLGVSASADACTRLFMNMYPGYMVSAPGRPVSGDHSAWDCT